MLKIADVWVEYRKDPIGIDNENPLFGWKFEAVPDVIQSSYRIIVASNQEFLNKEPDLWDSGEICSAETIGIVYAGKKLYSMQKAYVCVIIKDNKGDVCVSPVATFEMGLLEKSDWKGSWLALPTNFIGGALRFRKIIELPKGKKIVKARAYVCGLGYHEFYVNGSKIGDSVLEPSVTEYEKRVEYSTYDFTKNLHTNKNNVVAFELGNGWYGTRKLLAQFYITFSDGTVFEDHSSPVCGWWVSGSPIIDNSIYGGEIYDATLEEKYPLVWATDDFKPGSSNGWMSTIVTAAPEGELQSRYIEPIKVNGIFPVCNVIKKSESVFIYDVGQNLAGWARIKVQGKRKARVTLKFGEDLTADGFVNQLNLRSARCSDTYILKGDGIEEYAPKYTYHGFRYVQAEIEGEAEILDLVAEHVHTAVKKVGSFRCSDETLNRLHNNAAFTEANNLHSIMTDCPQRDERFGWLNDLGSRLFQTVYNYGMERFFSKFVRDITHTQTKEGAIADTAPYYTGGKPADPVCIAYLLFGTLSYQYYGNRRICEEEYDGFKAWVDYLLSRCKNYIMDYYIYADWVQPACFTDVHTDGIYISTTYLYWHLLAMQKIAQIVGNTADAQLYAEHAKASRKAIVNKYFDEENVRFASGTQSENAIALWLGLVPTGYEQALADNIYKDVVKHGYHSTCGNIGYRHLFYVLSDYGYTDAVVKILTNPEYPGWGYMIAKGATTVWERWESEMQNEMHSFDHPMFGSYDAWLYHYLGGIAVDEDAFGADKITIKPYIPTEINFVECSFETLRGKIVSNWKKQADGSVCYHIEIPATTTAKVILGNLEKTLGCGVYDFKI